MRWLIIFLVAMLLGGCGEPSLPELGRARELVVLTREGPISYEQEAVGVVSGFEHDLVQLFAEELGLKVRFVVARRDQEIVERLKRGEAHLAAAWLSAVDDPSVRAGPSYFASSNVIAQHEASIAIDEPGELAGRNVHVIAGSRQAAALKRLAGEVAGIEITEHRDGTELDLLERVAAQQADTALVDSALLDIAGNYYPELQPATVVGDEIPIVWLYPADGDASLAARLEKFFARITADGTLARLRDRYFGHVERLRQGDVAQFIERTRTVLPQYRPMFQSAQAATGIDWRLLAALAYQESQWNPLATSPTGVRGMMMLTEDTANHLRVGNRLDARQSIRAGSRYFSDLRDNLPESVPEPDRTWMAVAAYNLGMGHFNGARQIAQGMKKDADSWYEMKQVLPLLARPEIYRRLKSGRARGGEAVITAENVRLYYDILCRFEAPYRPFAEGSMSGDAARIGLSGR